MTMTISAASGYAVPPSGKHEAAVTFAFATTSLGQALVAATSKGICAILLGSDRNRLIADLRQHFAQAQPAPDDRLADAVARVAELIENPSGPSDLELDLQGSD